jgi:predicted transcriptional regulator
MMLGDLEHRVLEAAWALKKPATARSLFDCVARSHDVVYITCVTVANRLVDKGLLTRTKVQDVYHYSATLSKQEFTEHAARHVVQRLVTLGSAAVSASLVDVLAERDPALLEDLARLVEERLNADRK